METGSARPIPSDPGNLCEDDQALADAEKALTLDATHVRGRLYRAYARLARRDVEGARADFAEVVRTAPGTDEAKAAQAALDSLKP